MLAPRLGLVALVSLLTASNAGAQTALFHEPHRVLPLDVLPGSDAFLVDLDGDGDRDAFVANAGQNRLYANDGLGFFVDATSSIPVDSGFSTDAAFGDVDGDADVDALIGNSGQNQLLLGDGAGNLADATDQMPTDPDLTAAVAVLDLDLDGDLDVLTGNAFTPNRLYVNRTRQVSWHGRPRIGKPLQLDLSGTPPAGFWALARSLGTFLLPFPPFGTLLVDPTTLVVLGFGALDASGSHTFVVAVPSDPALVGLDVHFQAAIGVPFRFTNRELTLLTDL